jgi:alpha-methylacyl-CoA racemase
MGGIGPGPFTAMMLADMGADIIRLERPDGLQLFSDPKFDVMLRSRKSVMLDIKKPEGVGAVLDLVEQADALIEGFRPGVMESLGLGPDECLSRNPSLVYGRITGWGQDGPLARAAGHDMNYIALTGALHAIGRRGEKPVPPLNLVGDFGGGGMLLAFGMVCALLEARRSDHGQVVDAAMVDGAASLMAMVYGFQAAGLWRDERGVNLLDTGAHFYDTYETSDGKWVSIGSIEPQFYALLLEHADIEDPEFKHQMDPGRWPALKEKLAAIIQRKTRDEWCEIMEGTDVCFAPVLSLGEAPAHPHNEARGTFVDIDGVPQPAPSPRFSRTPGEIQSPPPKPGEHTKEALADWGFTEERIAALKAEGVI